jgi:SAM-dependent methyltransferase
VSQPSITFPPDFFRRDDDGPDALFFEEPRLVVHIDEGAIDAVRAYLDDVLPDDATVLDLMSSWRSHLPEPRGDRHVVGLGMNATELAENPQLHERIVHDLNTGPVLPLASGRFDTAIVTVSVQYITRPIEVFAEVRRTLKEGAVFHVLFSDRMFATKAVAIWKSLPDPQRRGELIGTYFGASQGWDQPLFLDRSPSDDGSGDPLYVVRAARVG